MTSIFTKFLACGLSLGVALSGTAAENPSAPPSVMLASRYAGQNIAGWLASEKLDGVRGFWDGEKFYSRNGKLLPTPAGFTDDFPPFPLDGELFGGRGTFAATSGKIRRGEDWTGIAFHVFDAPEAAGGVLERLQTVRDWLARHPTENIVVIEQTPVADIASARARLAAVEKKGGEGLILRAPNAPYSAGRSPTSLKLKSTQDAECTVTAHHAGKGKYRDVLGALSCQLADGRVIRIGSGFSDAERAAPPEIGRVITFRYRGLTAKGKPRFATFWRVRADADLSR